MLVDCLARLSILDLLGQAFDRLLQSGELLRCSKLFELLGNGTQPYYGVRKLLDGFLVHRVVPVLWGGWVARSAQIDGTIYSGLMLC